MANTLQKTLSRLKLIYQPSDPIFENAILSTNTWDDIGTTFIHTLVNITDTNSNAASKFFAYQIGGVNKATLDKGGGLTLAGSATIGASGNLAFNTRSLIFSPSNGNILLTNNSSADFGLLIFGDNTNAFPAIKRSTTELQAKLGDDSAFTIITSSGNRLQGSTSGNILFKTPAIVTDYSFTLPDAAPPSDNLALLGATSGNTSWTAIVNSIAGTSNQVNASASTGAITLSLPQDIATSSSPQFAALGLNTSNGTGGTIKTIGSANNLTLLNIIRNTDTVPTGKFIDFQSAALASLFTVDITGAITSGSYQANPVTVPYGGSGVGTFTPYSIICGGTTGTGNLQNVTGVGTTGQLLTSNGAGTLPTWQTASIPLSSIVAATADALSANHANNAIQWSWNTLAGRTAFTFASGSTAATSNAQRLVAMYLSGNNANASQTTYVLDISNAHPGGGTNIGIYASCTQGTNNYAGIFFGSVGINIAAPTSIFHARQTSNSTNVTTPVMFNIDSGGSPGQLTASSSTQVFAQFAPTINQTSTAGYTALKINVTQTGTGSGSKLLTDWQVGGVSFANINNVGQFNSTSGTITSSTPFLNHSATWNNVSTTFVNLYSNITNTASATASRLLRLDVGGTEKLGIGVDGSITAERVYIGSFLNFYGFWGITDKNFAANLSTHYAIAQDGGVGSTYINTRDEMFFNYQNAERARLASSGTIWDFSPNNTLFKVAALSVVEGTNKSMGTATFASGTVTVSTTKVTANSRIFIQRYGTSTKVGIPQVNTRSAGTSFTVTSIDGSDGTTTQTGDDGSFAWFIVEPA